VTVVTMLDQPELVPERLDTPSISGTRVRAARWWLALILTDWAYELTRRETGDAPVWLLELAMEDVRAHLALKTSAQVDPAARLQVRNDKEM
jgi:hypothetical protein